MKGRNSIWCLPGMDLFFVTILMNPDHSGTGLEILAEIRRMLKSVAQLSCLLMFNSVTDFSITLTSSFCSLWMYWIRGTLCKSYSFVGLYFEIGCAIVPPFKTQLLIIPIIWRVFFPSMVACKMSALSAEYNWNQDFHSLGDS